MIRLSGIARLAIGFVFLAGSTASQQVHRVWVVDAVSQVALQNAVNAAAEGDTVLVKASGDYTLFVQSKSLTVIADPPADVRITAAEVKDLTAAQRVELRGLKFRAQCEMTPGLKLVNNAGLVWIEDCTILGGSVQFFCETIPGILVDRCADVVLLRTSSAGTGVQFDLHEEHGPNEGHGLVLMGDSRLVAHGCTFQGADGHHPPNGVGCLNEPGAAGLYSQSPGDRVFLSDCQATGGDGIYYWDDDCGGPDCSSGGPGISSAGVTWMFDSQATGGSGGSGFGCSAPAGPAFTGNVQSIPGQALRFSVTAPAREGGNYQLDFQGPANTPTWLLTGASPAVRFRPQGPLVIGMPTASFAGITDATGGLHITRSMPMMPPGLELGRLYVQAFYLDQRGRFVMGGASMFLALDQSF